MNNWHEIVAAVYYTGAGAVLLGTTLRYIYRLIKDQDEAQTFVEEMETTHLPNIYSALRLIAKAQGVELPFDEIPRLKSPRKQKDSWIKLG